MDGRDAFLTMARDRHLEFSSLRRCKYSSLAMLYELHTQAMVRFLIQFMYLTLINGGSAILETLDYLLID